MDEEELEPTLVGDAVESFIAAAGALEVGRSVPVDHTAHSGAPQAEADVWGTRDDEDGWMPKPARLHSGRTQCCAVCAAPLQYTSATSWDEYLQSEEHLDQLQANVLQDAFISSIICGETTAGDLPTEHRMHKSRKLKCRQSVTDYMNMTSAGVMDASGMEKGSVRTLEEMLVEALPTPVYTHVLERRLAVISHSVKIARELMSREKAKKMLRPAEKAPGNEELHHLAIHTLSALLGAFDYKNPQALRPFKELAQLLTYFPVLSLYTFWSPMKKPPETVLTLGKEAVSASSETVGSEAHEAHCAVNGVDNTYWQSQSNPGIVYFGLRTTELAKATSISIHWHMKCVPQTVGLQYRLEGSGRFVQIVKDRTVSLPGPTVIETCVPVCCREARIVMAGASPVNGSGTYAIEHLRLTKSAPSSLFADPIVTINAIADWLLGTLSTANEVMIAEALEALRAWALSTASLNVTLLFADMLLELHADEKKPLSSQVVALASEQGHLLLNGINAYHHDRSQRGTHGKAKVDHDEVCNVDAVFESSRSSAGVAIEQDGLVVRTRETRYQYAAVNCGITTGKASWRFRLDADTQDDEMTCFGAAILPVTVNGYDSSPSLWMLRGYNGNLYARGHKLSQTIGKVHPGDIVQVDVDMSEGTLAYKINSTDYGVVFNDLAGHEIHPAVSFYGSGKVVTLLEVTKWDYPSDLANANLVFLSNIREYHFSVGYGTLGKSNQLGCADNGDTSASPDNDTPTSRSTLISINGEDKQHCLSTCPLSHDDAYVIYDLSEAYHTVSGAVAVNDVMHDEDDHDNGVALVYRIFGDAKLLWQSKPVSTMFRMERFEVSVKNVRMLEMRVSCQGSDHHAHAIWVDPCLHPVEEWACSKCNFANLGSANACAICMTGPRNQGLKVVDSPTIEEALKRSMPHAFVEVGHTAHDSESLCELGTTIIGQIYNLYEHGSNCTATVKPSIQFEEPFCRQPSKDVFSLLLAMLRRYHGSFIRCGVDARSSGNAERMHDGCVYILGIICANLESITCYDVNDPAVELGLSIDLLIGLRDELEVMTRLREAPQTLTDDIEKAAAQTIVTGLPVLYPSATGKLELLLQLLRLYVSRAMDVTPACYFVLTSVMELLATPGPDGILTLMPFVAAEEAKRKGSSVDEVDKAAWVSAVTETIKILMQIAVNAQEREFAADTYPSSIEADVSRDRLPDIAIHLMKTYQLYLLSEAVGLTKDTTIERAFDNIGDANESEAAFQRRLQVQEASIQFGLLSLSAYTDLISSIVSLQAEESFILPRAAALCRASVRSFNIPLLSDMLPWFVACSCLMRRQTWFARQILPAAVRLLEVLDHFCSESQAVAKSAHRFQELEIYKKARLIEAQETERAIALEKDLSCRSHNSKRLYNVFRQLYTGEKDHFEGQIGFQFEAVSFFTIVALGRSVNPIRHGGRLIRDHTIRLWEDESQALVAQVTIGGNSKKDDCGYVFEMLPLPAKLTQGKLYRLTTQEFANGGDPWYKRENLLDEEYDKSFIKILRDCYASGSAGFPASQNMIGAAYGVPTFMVQDEAPLARLPLFVPPHGCLSLRFDPKKKLSSVCISHTGTSVYVKDGSTDTWRTCLLRTAFLHGVHSVDFSLKCLRAGGTSSGHVCIGIDWQQAHEKCRSSSQLSAYEMFVGKSTTSVGWMPSIGSVWIRGARYDYGPKLPVAVGDIFTMIVDYDLQLLSFAYNGRRLGVAVGPKEFKPLGATMEELPKMVFAGVSLYSTQDLVQLCPSGIVESSLQVHWLFDLHNSLASLAGRIAGSLIAGHPIYETEEELLPWLQSSLLSGGIAKSDAGQHQSCKNESLLWSDALQAECARYLVKGHTSESGVLTSLSPSTLSNVQRNSVLDNLGSGGRSQASEVERNSLFWEEWTADMTDHGSVQLIMSWLEKHYPDSTLLSRLGRFPSCERWMCAALIMHAPAHVLQEVQAIAVGARASEDGENIGADPFVAYTDLAPSDDLICVWKRVMMLRHRLIKIRQGYRAREADDSSRAESGLPEEKPGEFSATPVEQSDTSFLLKQFGGKVNLERSVVAPKTFDDHLQQMIQRARFLCKLAPPSEEADRLKGDSHVALFKLAEKWSTQTTFPSLKPVLERWKVLGKADRSKWSGIVDILRAQHRWRARRASTQSLASTKTSGTSAQSVAGDATISTEGSGDLSRAKKYHYTNTFSAMMKACELYIRDGTGAPPEVLTLLLERRQRRSDCRLFGLQAMKSILSTLSFDSAIHNAIIFLRPAMRGFTESEKESREQNDGHVIAETFRATVRHHYLKGLEGCNRQIIEKVQTAFRELYTYLAQLLGSGSGHSVSDPQLKQSILCAWCLDFEAQDHQFLLDTGMLLHLQEIFSISSVQREVVEEYGSMSRNTMLPRESFDIYSSINWHPLSEKFVQEGLVRSGYVTKRDVLRLLRRAPRYACPVEWWQKNDLENDSDAISSTARHTASSLSLLYADMLAKLERKLQGPFLSASTSKVLQFGDRKVSKTVHGGQTGASSKPDKVSYVEMPALGEVKDFTIEMWIFPTELGEIQALRCDHGVQTGSVYLELIGRRLQVSIPGNFPREQLFESYQFETFVWTHCAVTYDAENRHLQFFVNGDLSEKMEYERVCSSVTFRPSRLGCWMNSAGTHGAALENAFSQREFKGSIAEVRIWKTSRTRQDIQHDFQRSIPLVKRSNEAFVVKSRTLSNDMIGLWHLTEGEGIYSFDRSHVLEATACDSDPRSHNLTISHCLWVSSPSRLPVFGSGKIDDMSVNEWSWTVMCIRSFQRKIRSWLTTRFHESVRITKLVCAHEEHNAMKRWNSSSRTDVDSDVKLFDDDDGTYTDGSTGHQLDTTTSRLLSQWAACTDEQIIIRKHTRKCAWVVFRFLASTGISGAYDRREEEARAVAAAAKTKRKKRLQKSGGPGNVASSAVNGLLRTEVSHASPLGVPDDNSATRTAEVASEAAKCAATNRELEEPVLQTLWFSKEFHRKVFEALEEELLRGKELTEEAEGLTRAQRMLRSASTPVKNRGAGICQYPSDITREKSGFVHVHNACPSNVSGNSERLESLEVEMHTFGVLLFMLSQSQQSSTFSYLVRPQMLRGLLGMLRLASPRSQRVVKLLLRRMCCSGHVRPDDVGDILGSESVLIDLLLDQVAESVCSTAAPMATHAVVVPANSVQVGATVKEDSMTLSESLSNPMGYRSGDISLVVASESVALLRHLLVNEHWKEKVSENLCNAIHNIAPILARKTPGPQSIKSMRASSDSFDIRLRTAIIRAVGALCVLGTHSDCIRIGGKVAVPTQNTNISGACIPADASTHSVTATLIEMSARDSTIRVVFHPHSSESDFDPSHNVQDVDLTVLSPTEEVLLPPSAVPLTTDMLPVILQLSLLESSSLLEECGSLWRSQIRSRALLALEALLHQSAQLTKRFAHDTVTKTLIRFALTPVCLDSFVSLPLLQERGRMVLCRLIESSTPLGEAMFHGLQEPTVPALATSESTSANVSGIEVNNDPAEEETEAYRVRRGFASTLAAMGFEFDLCMSALEHSRDDPNLAVEWLMGDGAATYQERRKAQYLARASLAVHELAHEADGRTGLTIEAKAMELEGISGMPYCLALCALELSNSNPDHAMEWLMEHGSTYAEKPDSLALLSDAFLAARSVVLEDQAALEEIDQPDPLVLSSNCHTTTAAEHAGSNSATRGVDQSYAPKADAMAVTLAPILASVLPKSNLGVAAARDASTTAFFPLDPGYLTPNVLLTVTSDVGPVHQLATSGRTGIYRRYSPDDGVLLTFLNTESGACEDEWIPARDLRRVVRIYDEPLEDVNSIHRVAIRTEDALSTYYARRAITALLCSFTPVDRSRSEATGMATDESADKPPLQLSSYASEIMNVVGGPRQFLRLLKMASASEMHFTNASKESGFGLPDRSWVRCQPVSDNTEQHVSLLTSMRTLALRILREESRTAAERRCLPSLSTKGPICRPVCQARASHEEQENASGRVTAMPGDTQTLSRSTAAVPATLDEARHGEWLDHESKDEDAALECTQRTCQLLDIEAQKGASAYMGDNVDDHDTLLSSVLIEDCVGHFVESTRMAGDGEGTVLPLREFQSLHPYFGRCDYARVVRVDSPCSCLRIVFDHRCRLGAKTTLTFFADSDCKERIGVVDDAMTATGHLLPDMIIRSHQFWFRFTASEEHATNHTGYGYRFQVKPMASIRWTKESEVLTGPSLEWACWVLELLLNDATELIAHGGVHNRKIYGALVRYLRSPGTPHKGRIVRLLQQLLHHPELFPADEVPDLDALQSICRLALTCAEGDQARKKVFISAHLLQIVELSMMTSSASSAFQRKLAGANTTSGPVLSTPFDMPVPFERKCVADSLNDVSVLTKFLLGQVENLPEHILVAIWLEVYGSSAVIESSHPYAPGRPSNGVVVFEGAQALRVTFDSRCSLAPGHGQTMPRLDLASYVITSRDSEAVKDICSNRVYSEESTWPDAAVSYDGNNLEYTFLADENEGGHFGFAVTVNALGILQETQLARATVTDMERVLQKLVLLQTASGDLSNDDRWTEAMDSQLVDWVNKHVEPPASLPSSSPTATRHSVHLQPVDVQLSQTLDGVRCSKLLNVPLETLQLRFALLKYLNSSLQHCLSFIDLRDTTAPWTLAYRLRQLSHCIFFDVKNALVEAAIEATNMPRDISGANSQQQTARITLDRIQALESRDDREVEPSVSECFFAQAFRQLHQVDPTLLRRQIDSKGRLFSVKFRGEEGVDWGGVYREGATSMIDDLFSPHFHLFVLCPNGQHDTGDNRGMYLPNPKCTSPVAIQMFAFVGQLLGISLRTHGDFPFMLPSLVWKRLIGQTPARADLEATDAMFVQMLDGIANCEKDGISTGAEFDTAFDGLELRFTASSCTGEEMELVPGGRLIKVEFHNRLEYCRLAELARLDEGSAQVAAIAQGFATLFPRRVLTLLTWQELEILACGSPKIDLDLWQRHTLYDGYSEDDPAVLLFWEILAEFTDAQRADFVRFAWGRSRLPRGKWLQPFKLSKKGGRDATRSLPVAHTCFFSVELPPYTSRETMRSMLLATITFGLGGILMA